MASLSAPGEGTVPASGGVRYAYNGHASRSHLASTRHLEEDFRRCLSVDKRARPLAD